MAVDKGASRSDASNITHSLKRSGKLVEAASDDLIKVRRQDFGLWQIEIDTQREDSADDASETDIDRYFLAPLDLFPPAHQDLNDGGLLRPLWRLLRPLRPRFVSLWPGFFEDQLAADIDHRMGEVDRDVRKIIDRLVDVFVHNLGLYIFLKRSVQFLAILVVQLAASMAIAIGIARQLTEMQHAILVSCVVGIALFISLIFVFANNYVYSKCYKIALTDSLDDVREKLKNRLSSIYHSRDVYKLRLDRALPEGQTHERLDSAQADGNAASAPKRTDSNASRSTKKKDIDDDELRSGDAFQWTEMLVWLAMRTLEIERYLKLSFQRIRRKHFWKNVSAFFAVIVIWLVGLLPPLLFAVFNMNALKSSFQSSHSIILFVDQLAIILVVVVATTYISWLSYYGTAWPSGMGIIEEDFKDKIKDWHTFSELKVHLTLGARSQQAMARIAHLDWLLKQ